MKRVNKGEYDKALSAVELLRLAIHETYPGHHTERATKEQRLSIDAGWAEEAIQLVPTPQALVSEGIAEIGLDVKKSKGTSTTAVAAALRAEFAAIRETLALAGLTLAALAIPEVMGYATIAGMPVVTGLYTLVLPTLVFAFLGSSRHLVVGADSATAMTMAAGLTALGLTGGSAEWIAMAGLCALLVAAVLLAGLVVLATATPALAHTTLRSSNPADGATLAATRPARVAPLRVTSGTPAHRASLAVVWALHGQVSRMRSAARWRARSSPTCWLICSDKASWLAALRSVVLDDDVNTALRISAPRVAARSTWTRTAERSSSAQTPHSASETSD